MPQIGIETRIPVSPISIGQVVVLITAFDGKSRLQMNTETGIQCARKIEALALDDFIVERFAGNIVIEVEEAALEANPWLCLRLRFFR